MKLYLMRHGEATASPQNPEQTLTPQGRSNLEKLAGQLAQKGIRVKQVFHSEKMRARQSAEIMAIQIAPDISLQAHSRIKPNDDPQLILDDIKQWHDDTLIVSHLPFIPGLLGLLLTSPQPSHPITFEPGTVICLSRENTSWQIEWIESPTQ